MAHRAAAALILGIALWMFVPPLAAHGGESVTGALGAADRAEINRIIGAQIDAFRRDDAHAAFAFASPGIRRMFGDAETFMEMVRTGYRPVYRPRRLRFLDIIDFHGQPTQRVFVVGPDGVGVVAYYLMERQADGSWRIDGCILSTASRTSA
ncbi:MAG: DUF4864 domain-containing protein [Alphaproteobacteria bacterium]